MPLQAVPLPTPMTREEITSYRPAQDPPIDPSQGQAPVQVSTNLAVEPRPPPRAPVMSTAEIAAYRSGEDPAYDPVERRGWWEVDMAQGRPFSNFLESKNTQNNWILQENRRYEIKYAVNPISCSVLLESMSLLCCFIAVPMQLHMCS